MLFFHLDPVVSGGHNWKEGRTAWQYLTNAQQERDSGRWEKKHKDEARRKKIEAVRARILKDVGS